MRIGIHAVTLLPRLTGRETYVQSLLGALAQIDQSNEYCVLVSPANRHLFERPEGNFHTITVRLPSLPSRRLWETAYLHLSPLVRGLDVIHLPEAPVPFFQPPKAVATVHDILPVLYPEFFARKARVYYQKALSLGARHLTNIIVSSEQTKADLMERFPVEPERIRVIYHGIGHQFRTVKDAGLLQQVRERYGLPERFILYVGTVEPRKNLVRLIRAFRRLRQRGLPHALVIAGNRGWLCDDIFQEASKGEAAGNVLFTGHVAADDLPHLYGAAALFVYPSLYEGFGIPPLEAMASGIPVVCSNRSSLPEVVGDAALLIDPEDEQAIAAAIEQGVQDEGLRARLRRKGLERASLFSWEKAARETLQLYEDTCRLSTSRGKGVAKDVA